jgi:hypothetical protein
MKKSARKRSVVECLASTASIFMGVGLLASLASAQAIQTPPSSQPAPGLPSNTQPEPPAFAACFTPKFTAWIAAQHPAAPYPVMMAKKDELIAECGKQLHVDVGDRCEAGGAAAGATPPRSDDMPGPCHSTPKGSETDLSWHPINNSIVEKTRPTDGRFADGRLAVYEAFWKPRVAQPSQGDPPDALYGLLYYDGSQRALFPLNYAANDPQRIELPIRGPAQLAITPDSHQHTYLLYMPSMAFLTPSWDSTQASLENLYVWWLDPQKHSLRRVSLPQGPWVDDAKLDKVLARDMRNFSCGTGCYRQYDIGADSGNVLVTITGRASAVSEKVLGTYKFGPNDTKWTKIRDGKPEQTS